MEDRADDDPEPSRTRLAAYREQTAPVLAWYESAERRCAGFRRSAPSRRSPSRVGRGARSGSMITLKSPREIDIMARAGRIVAGTLALMRELVRPGSPPRSSTRPRRASSAATTGPRRRSRASTASPRRSASRSTRRSCTAFRRPGGCCATGSIVSVDVGVQLEGLHADSATTVPVGTHHAGGRAPAAT